MFEQVSIQSGKHVFFTSISPEQLDELVRGAMKKMTCRSNGNASRSAFGRKIRDTVLGLVNCFQAKFRLDINRTTVSIILATGSVDAGLQFHTRSSALSLKTNQNRCLVAALMMFDLGINDNLQDSANVSPILDGAFGDGTISLPQGKFAKLAQSAATQASQDLEKALLGSWESICPKQARESAQTSARGQTPQRGRGGSSAARGGRGRGGANFGDRHGQTQSEKPEQKPEQKPERAESLELTVENLAALQAQIRALKVQLETKP